jgi:hypothetical protein
MSALHWASLCHKLTPDAAVNVPAGMALSQQDWQSAIKLLEDLAAMPGWSSTALARGFKYVFEIEKLMQRLAAVAAGSASTTRAAWSKLVKKQVCVRMVRQCTAWLVPNIVLVGALLPPCHTPICALCLVRGSCQL